MDVLTSVTCTDTAVFRAASSHIVYKSMIRDFETTRSCPIPVPTWGRPDIEESIRLSEEVYGGAATPTPADLGVCISKIDRAAFAALIGPLAIRWTESLEDMVTELAGRSGEELRVILVGTYDALRMRQVWPLITATFRYPKHSVGFISGRDLHSLLWFAAKQWACERESVRATGFFSEIATTQTGTPLETSGARRKNVSGRNLPALQAATVSMFASDLARANVRSMLLGRAWRRLLFQGHGKDDVVNLDEWGVCGKNQHVEDLVNGLRPRCGYGHVCFKNPDKVVPIMSIRAAEIVLSSCNTGPLSDLALYDPKYILLLSAIDGCAKHVSASLTVHNSSHAENERWARSVLAVDGTSISSLLNNSLRDEHPYPAFWHFGMPGRPASSEELSEAIPSELEASAERVSTYLLSGLISTKHSMYRSLVDLNAMFRKLMSRSSKNGDRAEWQAQLKSYAKSLAGCTQQLAGMASTNAEDPITQFGPYLSDMGVLANVHTVTCNCGRDAFAYEKRGRISVDPGLECVICLRCGDTVFRWPGAPVVQARSAEVIRSNSLDVDCEIEARETGPCFVGIYVPNYMRKDVDVKPKLARLTLRAGDRANVNFHLTVAKELPGQAYYYIVFAIQNLGQSTLRRHFGLARAGIQVRKHER